MPKVKSKFIGGEYFYSPSILLKKKKFDLNNYLKDKYSQKYFYFTGGGYYSIIGILQQLKVKDYQNVLLPSYLCPTILYPFKRLNIKYRFFKIKNNLDIDIRDIENKIDINTRAIYFIDYFGFPQNDKTISFLRGVKKTQNIILIQDIAQSFFSDNEMIGDFAFNSFRKFLPVDGSIIISDEIINYKFEKSYVNYHFQRFYAQFLRYLHIKYNIGYAEYFLKYFHKADKSYYKEKLLSFNKFNRYLLSKYDIGMFSSKRKRNYSIIFEIIKDKVIYKVFNKNNVPLGIPIIVENRNTIRNELIKKNIFCPIHWKLSDEIDKNEFAESWYLSEHLLTIPVRENFGESDLNYLIENLKNILK